MELDEKLFHFAWKTKRRFSKEKTPETACLLESKKDQLAGLSCAFFGKTIYIKNAEQIGGLIGNSLFVPKYINLFDSVQKNYRAYLFRILYDSTAFLNGFYFRHEALHPDSFKLLSLICAPTFLKNTFKLYPNTKDIFNEQITANQNSRNSSEYFFNTWQLGIITPQSIYNSKLSDENKEYLTNLIKKTDLTPSEAIELGKMVLADIKKMNIDHKYNYELLPVFSNLPKEAQKLILKKSGDSKINEAKKDEEEKTLKNSKSKEQVKNVELDENDPNCNPANLLMDGVQTADIFSGGKKMLDGSDEMDDHFDSIEDLDIREVTRSTTQTQSIFKAEISVSLEQEDLIEDELITSKSFFYDEWDYKKKGYRKDWCSLNEVVLSKQTAKPGADQTAENIIIKNQKQIKNLKHEIEKILNDRKPKARQKEGPDIDLDALINAKADIMSGHTPSSNLYISKRKVPSEFSMVILLDSSLSSDSWVDGKRVLDIAKESVVVLEEVLKGYFENIMISSFFSNTRKNSQYNIIKNFKDPWGKSGTNIDDITPTGYTRIGVALRHSFHHLEKVKTKNKVVLLLSDGKPTDYDAYEGKQGISDVRQCVREAKSKDIDIYALAIDKDSKFYFPQLFGAKNYEVLSSPELLSEKFIKLLSRMI